MNDRDEYFDEYRKPTHDGRVPYYKTIEKLLLSLESASITGDIYSWFKSLRSLYLLMAPHCPKEDLRGVKEDLDRVYGLIIAIERNKASTLYRLPDIRSWCDNTSIEVEKTLTMIEGKIHSASKDMMLPHGGEVTGDLDVDEALRGSGI